MGAASFAVGRPWLLLRAAAFALRMPMLLLTSATFAIRWPRAKEEVLWYLLLMSGTFGVGMGRLVVLHMLCWHLLGMVVPTAAMECLL